MKLKSYLLVAALLLTPSLQAQDEPASDAPVPAEESAEAEQKDEAESAPAAPAGEGNVFLEGFGNAIPTPYPADRYASTWEKNPFLVEVAPTQGPVVSFAQDWALTGLTVRPSGEATAYIRNKQTQEFKRVTSNEDKDGFKLIEANPNPDRKLASVKVAKGAETASLTYDETMTAPAPQRIPVPGQQQPGAPPQPGVMPGRPVIPVPGAQDPNKRVMGQPGAAQQPGMAQPGVVPTPNPAQPGMAQQQIPRSPQSRRRILIPPQIPQPGAQQPVP